jgi:hypothetical protein
MVGCATGEEYTCGGTWGGSGGDDCLGQGKAEEAIRGGSGRWFWQPTSYTLYPLLYTINPKLCCKLSSSFFHFADAVSHFEHPTKSPLLASRKRLVMLGIVAVRHRALRHAASRSSVPSQCICRATARFDTRATVGLLVEQVEDLLRPSGIFVWVKHL